MEEEGKEKICFIPAHPGKTAQVVSSCLREYPENEVWQKI